MENEERYNELYLKISSQMSEYRFRHTAEVEKMAVRLGELYAPDKLHILRAAALLHDITKELSYDEHIAICSGKGIKLSAAELNSPKTLHAITAAAVIGERYPMFAQEEIISSVRWHTTGKADMSICEKLIFLADYIDMSRTFDDCIFVREYFFGARPEEMSAEQRGEHLRKTLVLCFDLTLKSLVEEGAPISPHTVDARNYLITEK